MAKLKTAAPVYVLPKVVHVDYLVRAAKKDPEDRTDFDGPLKTRTDAVRVLVENENQIPAILDRVSGARDGETIEVIGQRVIAEQIYTVVGGYAKESTGADPAPKASKASKKKKR